MRRTRVRRWFRSGDEMVKSLLDLLRRGPEREPGDGERLRDLVGSSEEPIVLADADGVVLAASPGSESSPGERLGPDEDGVPAYEELRSGFTAVVSHELRTPLARLLALL